MNTPVCLAPSPKTKDVPTLMAQQQAYEALIQQLNLQPCNESASAKLPLMLGWQQGKLSLFLNPKTPIHIDFTSGKLQHRLKFGGGKGQPLARAIGLHKHPKDAPPLTLIDATAGLAGDSFVFATLGCQVTLIERHPVIATLIQDALIRGLVTEDPYLHNILNRMQIYSGDACQHLAALACPDVIYLDPMYPEKRKTAAAKKGMQALQQLVGPDQDSEQLLATALQQAKKRVVVKRPKGTPPLKGPLPQAIVQSPNTRYDLYFPQANQTTQASPTLATNAQENKGA